MRTFSKIRKAVFPAAGFGTRFLPATKAQPKEMLPIVDKPVIQYLVEEAVAAGITEIVIITGRGKRAIEDHFDYSCELEYNLVEKGKDSLLKEVRAIAHLANIVYVRQFQPRGDGHAILCAQSVIGNEPFAVLFGDDIVDGKTPAIKQLMNVYDEHQGPVIAVEKVPRSQIHQYGVIKPGINKGRYHTVEDLVEKPSAAEAPSDLGIIGKYVMTPDIFDALKKAKKGKDGEIRLIDGMRILKKERTLHAWEVEGIRYDTGDKIGLLKANIAFALKRPELAGELKEYLKKIV